MWISRRLKLTTHIFPLPKLGIPEVTLPISYVFMALCLIKNWRDYFLTILCSLKCCSIPQTGHITLSSTPDQQLENHSTKYHRQQPQYNTLELLMMGIVVPETCWASNKICNKKPLLHLVGILFPHINDDAQSKSHQIYNLFTRCQGDLRVEGGHFQNLLWHAVSYILHTLYGEM